MIEEINKQDEKNDKKTRADEYLDPETKKFKEGNPGGGRKKGTRDWKTDFDEAVNTVAKQLGKTKSEVRTLLLVKGISEARGGNFNFWSHIMEREYGKIRIGIDFQDETEGEENKLADLLKNAKPETREKFIALFGELYGKGDEGRDLSSGSAPDDRKGDIPAKEKDKKLEAGTDTPGMERGASQVSRPKHKGPEKSS